MAHPGGRPTDYCDEMTIEILARIVEGRSLSAICRDADMPTIRTVYNWFAKYPEFLQRYAIAKQDSAETWADEIVDIADNSTNDWMANNDPENPGYKVNGESIQRSRLRVDTRKWLVSKLIPKKYGDRVINELTGADGGPIEYSDVERAKRVDAILDAARTRRAGQTDRD